MKLRNFKKWFNHRYPYRNHIPKIEDKIVVEENEYFTYYTCHNLKGRYCYDTKEFVYIIKKKRKRHEQD